MLGVFPCPILPGSGPPEPPLLSSPIRDLQLRLGQLHATSTSVTWAAAVGSIVGTGNTVTYNAPLAGGTYTVTATSVEDTSKSASASITVTPVSVSVAPSSAALFRGEPTVFMAAVTGTAGSMEVTWIATCGDAVPNGATLDYTAPEEVMDCDVTATSVLGRIHVRHGPGLCQERGRGNRG